MPGSGFALRVYPVLMIFSWRLLGFISTRAVFGSWLKGKDWQGVTAPKPVSGFTAVILGINLGGGLYPACFQEETSLSFPALSGDCSVLIPCVFPPRGPKKTLRTRREFFLNIGKPWLQLASWWFCLHPESSCAPNSSGCSCL